MRIRNLNSFAPLIDSTKPCPPGFATSTTDTTPQPQMGAPKEHRENKGGRTVGLPYLLQLNHFVSTLRHATSRCARQVLQTSGSDSRCLGRYCAVASVGSPGEELFSFTRSSPYHCCA